MAVDGGQSFEVHGGGHSLLEVEADWEVESTASLALAGLRLLGGSGGAAVIQSGGDVTLLRVEISSGTVSFSGALTVTDCALTSTQLISSTASSLLRISGGTLTGSEVSLSGGSVTIEGSSVLVDSPVSITAGILSLSQCELQSDGTFVPLTIESGGSAMVTSVVFRSSSGDDITVVSVSDGGSLTVGESQLVGADGSADPFPCDGNARMLLDCIGVHDGSVVVQGTSVINMAAPLVCDVETGECLADVCLARGDVCAEEAPDLSWLAGSTCVDGSCACVPRAGHDMALVGEWAAANNDGVMSVCLGRNVAAAVSAPCESTGCSGGWPEHPRSPTVRMVAGQLTVDCNAAALCQMLDRFEIIGPDSVALFRRLRFFTLDAGGDESGGAISVNGATLTVARCVFEHNHARGQYGGAISFSGISLRVVDSYFASNSAGQDGGGIFAGDGAVVISGCTFVSNKAGDCPSFCAGFGGAMYIDSAATLAISDSHFGANSAPARYTDSAAIAHGQMGADLVIHYTNGQANEAFVGPCHSDVACDHGSCTNGTCACEVGHGGDRCEIILYHLGGAGQTCTSVCASEGLECVDGNWQVHDEASLRTALQAAGEDPAARCVGDFGGSSAYEAPAALSSGGSCRWPTGARSTCSASVAYSRRLCLCV